jgi:rod shape-determining protein MreD
MNKDLSTLVFMSGAFFVGLILSAVSIPEWLIWGSPEWMALLLMYCVIYIPEKTGFALAFILGLFLDALQGSPLLGMHSLGFSLIVWFVSMMQQRLKMMRIIQQVMIVFMLIAVYLMVLQMIKSNVSPVPANMNFLVTSVVSALVWPWLVLLLNFIRNRFVN